MDRNLAGPYIWYTYIDITMSIIKKIRTIITVLFLSTVIMPQLLYAVPLTSTNYKLDPEGINAFGGQGGSANYKMVSSGGEAVVGSGSGGSYKLSSGYVGALQQSIELTLTDSGTQAYYPLNTNTGIQAYDATANNNHGVFAGGSTSPTWVSGKLGQGLGFDGNDVVTVTSHTNLTSPATFSWGGWVYPTNVTADQMFASKRNSNYLRIVGSKAFVSLNIGGQKTRTGTTNLPNNNWSHIFATYDGSVIKLYVNGIQEGADLAATGNVGSMNGVMDFGRFTAADPRPFYGTLDEFKMYNRALSAQEVRALYDANMAGIANAITVPEVVPGIPQTVGMDMTVITDAGGYDAAISQNNNLTHSDTTTTIPALPGGDITTPVLWDDGTTKGLGFTITGGLSVPAKWGTGPVNYKYAGLPGSATTFFSRTGLSGGQKEVTNLQFKLDVPTSQKSGQYTNIATVTTTLKP